MTDTQFEDKFLALCKKYKVPLEFSSQTELHCNDVFLEESKIDELKDMRCLVWLGTNNKGRQYGVIRNQVFLARNDEVDVKIPLNATFEECFNIWEDYFKGIPIPHIWQGHSWTFDDGDYTAISVDDVRLIIWTLLHGKWNYVLDYITENTYPFDFKKYLGRY